MNWKLIFLLSLFGLAMGVATVFWVPSSVETIMWPIIFIICAYIIAKNAPANYFLHGFLVSIVNCIWITGAHFIFYSQYILTQPDKVNMASSMHMANHPHRAMVVMGPLFGVVFGLILGLFAWTAKGIMNKLAATGKPAK